jgi:DNA-binding NtrC family response regulator
MPFLPNSQIDDAFDLTRAAPESRSPWASAQRLEVPRREAVREKALEMKRGNQVEASRVLGIARTTLRKKIEDDGIQTV